jgi:hypothetical protein
MLPWPLKIDVVEESQIALIVNRWHERFLSLIFSNIAFQYRRTIAISSEIGLSPT